MFPIIPQYLANKATTDLVVDYSNAASMVEYRAANVISPRDNNVIVSSVIEKNLESDDIEIGEILSSRSTKNSVEKIQIFSFNDKILCSANCWSWLQRTHLAEDCHSYNVELITSSSTHLRIRATRRILPEERLILWFSRDLIAKLQIPYLTLNNIRGESQYICHKCKFQCEWPNPLKIHLSLECGKLSRKDLWKRLQRKDDSATNFTDTITINSVIPGRAMLEIEKTHSAFKPYAKLPVADVRSNTNKMLIRPLSPEASLTEQKVPDFSQSMLYKQAVEMEAIVSHMGRIKQGHLCIYCGKIYSRKYGLKIHIRTHTGFKPLKCKFCLRPFGDPSNLNKHVRLHSEGDTPYKCELCNKILVRKRDLDRHMKSRH